MKSQQICNCALVVAVTAFLALALFIGGCHGVSW
jgi:hypothetical protein